MTKRFSLMSGLNNKVGGSWQMATPHLAKAGFYKPD